MSEAIAAAAYRLGSRKLALGAMALAALLGAPWAGVPPEAQPSLHNAILMIVVVLGGGQSVADAFRARGEAAKGAAK